MKDKLNEFYINKINKYLKNLDKNKAVLEKDIHKIEKVIEEKESKVKELEKNLSLQYLKYESFIKYIINKGLLFEINNKNLQLKEWESLIGYDEKNKIILKDKNQRIIKLINNEDYSIINDILSKGYKVNFLVIRASKVTALIQVFFTRLY